MVALCAREGAGGRAAGRQHRPGRRLGADRDAARDRALARPHEPHPRARRAERHDDGGGRLRARRGAGRGGGRRAPVSALARRRGQLPDRRQPLDQRRRRQRAALRQRARAGARPRGGAARRPRLERAARPAQGQHRLRPEAAVPRRRGHARRDHRRGAAALSQAHRERHGVDRASPARAQAVELLAALRSRVGDRISAFELVSRNCLEAVLAHVPDAAIRSARPHPGTCWPSSATAARQRTLRERVERRARRADEAVLAQSGEQARALWRIRESIPEAQFSNVKHDISVPISTHSRVHRARGCGADKPPFPSAQIFMLRPRRRRQPALQHRARPRCVEQRDAVNRDRVRRGRAPRRLDLGRARRSASSSARRSAGSKSPLELELMRALKTALDPQRADEPGQGALARQLERAARAHDEHFADHAVALDAAAEARAAASPRRCCVPRAVARLAPSTSMLW